MNPSLRPSSSVTATLRRRFLRFAQALAELIGARIWGGLHYRTADVQAEQLGRNVANYMAANYFQPVGRG